MTGSLLAAAVGIKQFAAFTKEDPKEIEAVLTKHGINEATVMEKMKSMGGPGAGKDAALTGATELAAMVKDGPGFVSDVFAVMKKMGKGKGGDSPADTFKNAKLSDVKVEGDRATGKAEIEGRTRDIQFAREDGAWKIDIVPLFMEKMK